MPPTTTYTSTPHLPQPTAGRGAPQATPDTVPNSKPAPGADVPTTTVRTTRINPRTIKLRPSDVAAMVTAHRAGTSVNQLAARYRVTPTTAAKALRAAGIDTSPRRISAARADRICRLYESGLSVQFIARQLSMPKSSVLNVLRRREVKMRSELRGGAKRD
jgi:lambda repressor-like predicted transcriptional regulator